ncbi:hypothetical protein [Sphingomonas sp. PAMC 26621]|uniref:hypothetical protein n=1 Tax=Sphingomonas sp. PAMC 26621 TaxID=1112213 RepID=UPI0002894D3A|nr:hypothetical protein [Sphingomonas sp. PAMC 26621]
MFKLAFTLATVALVGTSPAVARDRLKAPALSTAVAASGVDLASVSDRQRYCVIDTPTGSHIRNKVCKTRPEWLDEGFDPIAKK